MNRYEKLVSLLTGPGRKGTGCILHAAPGCCECRTRSLSRTVREEAGGNHTSSKESRCGLDLASCFLVLRFSMFRNFRTVAFSKPLAAVENRSSPESSERLI